MLNQRFLPNFSWRELPILIALLIGGGCGGGQQPVKPVEFKPPPTANAETLLRNGDFLGAATEYSRLAAAADLANASNYRAMSALAYLDAGDSQNASAMVSEITSDQTHTDPLQALAHAALALRTNLNLVTQALDGVDATRLTPYQQSVYYRVAGALAMQKPDYITAANALIAADLYALPNTQRAVLHNDIWRALSYWDDTSLTTERANAAATHAGWLDLAIMSRPNLHDSAALAGAISTWQTRYPQHPANDHFVEKLYELSENLATQAGHIALLLPFQGAYASAAMAIRDGFISAWYSTSGTAARPTISVYSVDSTSINSVYDTAVANGADLVVGPLEKRTVEVLASRGELPMKTLALNVLDSARMAADGNSPTSSALFFQFGLAPEDEAAAAAEKAWADGHTRAVAMTPETNWGRRVAAGFADRWQALGGIMLSTATYSGAETSYAQSVKHALDLNLSEARAAQLRRLVNRTIYAEPRRRADAEAIFLAGFPISARQVLPQLRYFNAGKIPVYATSHAFTGNINPTADQDLDGLLISDMPWLFSSTNANNFTMFKRNWPNSAVGAGRLYAFGIDAYQILPYLAQMRHQPDLRLPGATGQLRMEPSGRVVREPVWAKFAGGVPNLLHR